MNKLFCTPLFFILAAALAAQSSAPPWYLDKELSYPASHYIAAVGEGATRAEAEAAAVAAVSMFFNTKTEVRNGIIREFNEAVASAGTEFSKKTYINEGALIRSEEDLLGIRFAQSWHNQARGQWAALAYIDRQETAAMYEARVNANMSAINALAADAGMESEELYRCALLYRGLRLAGLTEELIKAAALTDSRSAAKYAPSLAAIAGLRSEYRARRGKLGFSLQVQGPDTHGRIERRLGELLEHAGFALSASGGPYTMNVQLSLPHETLPAGIFVRPGIALRLERDGKTFFSYSKNYERCGGRTLEAAYSRAFTLIEQDLEKNFMERFTAVTGG
jgi:hypothetical protein